jgi:hypothetical protein
MKIYKQIVTVVGTAVVVSVLSHANATESASEVSYKTILCATSYWYTHVVMRDPVFGTSTNAKPMETKDTRRFSTEPPPKDWIDPDFDDSDWSWKRGPFFSGYGFHQDWTLGMLCMRGAFIVDNPAEAKDLTLTATYRGGIVVYMNGKEVARASLPSGEITADTLADDYPPDAWLKPDGTNVIRWGWGDPEKFKDRCNLRIRKLEKVTIPAKLLRKGRNVLAVSIHRSATSGELLKAREWWGGKWNTAGIINLTLSAPADDRAIKPNITRPAGVQVWNANILAPIAPQDYGDPTVPIRPVKIVGTRNGTFSGQVILSSQTPVRKVEAKITELVCAETKCTIQKSNILVRYAILDGQHGCFDTLSDTPPDEKTSREVQPIWVTVSIPSDAKPGKYTGTLTVSAEGMNPVDVPVWVTVCDWRMPDPKDFTTFVDFVESPESVALRYNVPLWSDEHFKLIEKSFAQMARVGNKTVYLHLMCRSNHGNSQTIIRWHKKKTEGGDILEPDFSIMEKYLDLYIHRVGKPRFVIFYVSDRSTGQGYFGASDKKKFSGPIVSVIEGDTSEVTEYETPSYQDIEKAVEFWKPVAEGIRERLKARGLLDGWVIGIASDNKPNKETVEVWKTVAPEARWSQQGHGLDGQYFGVRVAYNTTVWKAEWAPDPSARRIYGWKRDNPVVCHFHRDIWKLEPYTQLLESRLTGEKNITGNQNGFGRMNADFWTVLKDSRGNLTSSISSRYPENSWAQCNIRMTPYLSPGPDGARSTVRYEMVCEGVQECEARIFLEKILLEKDKRQKLGEERATKIQELLDTRTRRMICAGGELGTLWYSSSGWQNYSMLLYNTAAEVANLLSVQ